MVLNLDEEKLSKERENHEAVHEAQSERGGGTKTMSRLNFLRLGMAGGVAFLGWRLWDLQKPFQDDTLTNQRGDSPDSPSAITRYITSTAPRGIIYDRAGKRLVSNQAVYSVTITANYLPDPSKSTTEAEHDAILAQRQDVYDNLARFLGMNYYIALIPEQVNGTKNKQGVFTNPERNAILNELEIITGISAKDWDKTLSQMAANKQDKNLFLVNEKDPFPTQQFDRYKYLRTKFTDGVLFLSDAERKMLEAQFSTPPYQPVQVWPEISHEDAMILTEKRLDMPGVDVLVSYVRNYEDPRLYSHILGYTGRFSSTDQLTNANKEALGDNYNVNDPEDPSSKIDVYSIDDRIGRMGVEGWMEPFLRGRKGAKEVMVNSGGQIIKTVRVGKPAQAGNQVMLTIDNELQKVVADSLEKWIGEANKTKSAKVLEGAAVVMDVNTGEVLSLVSFPFYDNNLYNKPGEKWTQAETEEIMNQEKAVQVNRATSGLYAPGSTFKLITASAALNEKKISPTTTFNCTHFIKVPTTKAGPPFQPYKCWGTHGSIDVVGAVENSCDIFFYNAAVPAEDSPDYGKSRYYNLNSNIPVNFNGMGIDLLNGYMALFNLGQPTGIELPGEYQGTLPNPQTKAWSIGETMTTAIGQGDVLMTPLQVCMMTACFANRGKLLQPKIVREVKDQDGKVVLPFEPKLIRDVTKDAVKWTYDDKSDPPKKVTTEFRLEQSVMELVRQGMLAVSSPSGTAASSKLYEMNGLKVAGKTGTAEYGDFVGKDKDGNDARATRAWFTAYAPYEKPEIAVTVLVASGDIGNEGSTFAVPAVKEILAWKFQAIVNPPKPTPTAGPTPPPATGGATTPPPATPKQ
jgi:penicillin-binding protein 2